MNRDSEPAPKAPPRPERLVENLRKLLTVTAAGNDAGADCFTGRAVPDTRGRVFGGQVIGQALMAAGLTVPERLPHSLHAYFLRPGDNGKPIDYQVDRDLDGGTFSNRRVVALQNGVPILSMTVSFHNGDRGVRHRIAMPRLPGPESAVSDAEWLSANAANVPEEMRLRIMRPRPLEMRRLDAPSVKTGEARDAAHALWVRAVAPLEGGSQLLQRAVLAFFSDMGLMSTALRPHGISWSMEGMQGASIDHALWFHDTINVSDWMLYAMESPWADHGRGMNQGRIFSQDGRLLASTAQEGLNRFQRTDPAA